MDLPTLTDKTTVFHVGNLADEREPLENSHEGRALSVGLHPDAWRRIARTVAGTTYELTNDSAAFVDYYAIDEFSPLIDYGVREGLVEPTTVHRVHFSDTEIDERRYFEFEDRSEAESEAQDPGLVDAQLETVETIKTTRTLSESMNYTCEPTGDTAQQLLTFEWAARETGHDGVWFDEQLDPANHSAPRGGILPGRLKKWTIRAKDDRRAERR